MHLHHDFAIDVDEICTIFVTNKRGGCLFQGCIFYDYNPSKGKQPRNYNVQPRLVGSRGFGGEVICLKRVLSEPKFGPPNQKFLDPPL